MKIEINVAPPAKAVPPQGRPPLPLPLIISGVAGGMVLLLAMFFFAFNRRGPKPPAAELPPAQFPADEELEPSSEMEDDSTAEVEPPRKKISILAGEPQEQSEPVAPPEVPVPATPTPPAQPKPKTSPSASPPKPSAKPNSTPKTASLPRDKLFQGFPTELTLPAPDVKTPTRLGPAPAEYTCLVSLQGGELAARSRHTFVLEPSRQGEIENAWELFVRDIGKSEGIKLADLRVREGGLFFTWSEEAATVPASVYLKNCAFALAAGSSSHTVQLRKKQALPRMAMLYEKKTYTFSLEDLPKARDVTLEFDFLAPKTLPRPRFVGKASVQGSGQSTWADFGVKGASYLKLQIDSKCNDRGFEVTLTPWIQFTPTAKPVALTAENLKKLEANETFPQEQSLQRQLAALPKADSKKKGNDPSAGQREALNKQLAAVKAAHAQIANLKNLKKDFETTGILKVRAYYQTEKAVVDLAASK